MDLIMKCLYCQRAYDLFQLEYPNGLQSADCDLCKVQYVHMDDGRLLSTIWKNIVVNGKLFYIKLYNGVSNNAPELIIYYVDAERNTWSEVKRLNFIPDSWTPQNTASKLKIYLPFL
jgi:hypothetical protein